MPSLWPDIIRSVTQDLELGTLPLTRPAPGDNCGTAA
jgi:hypothetical protein